MITSVISRAALKTQRFDEAEVKETPVVMSDSDVHELAVLIAQSIPDQDKISKAS